MESQEKVELTPEAESLRAYRAALLVMYPDGNNTGAKQMRPGTFERMNRTFKALPTKHRRRLDRFRCTIDRLVYIDRAMQKEVLMRT